MDINELKHNAINEIPMILECYHDCSQSPVITLEFGEGFPRDTICPNCRKEIDSGILTDSLFYFFLNLLINPLIKVKYIYLFLFGE